MIEQLIERPFFVVNPKSAGGETGRTWDLTLRKQVVERFPNARWAFTAAVGQGSRLAKQAWREGAELVVAVGGDGTVNEVVNGLMGLEVGDLEAPLPGSQGARWSEPTSGTPRPILGHLPRGTGCDFAKSLGIPKPFVAGLEMLLNGRTVASDVGEIQLTSRSGSGETLVRYFINIGGCGASGEVVERVNRSGKQLGGFLTFFTASLASTLRYYSPEVEISIDGAAPRQIPLNVLFVCNGQYCGGGMWVGPEARIDDGRFSVLEIAATSRMGAVLSGSRLYSGKIDRIPGARSYTARSIRVTSSQEVLVECDGEQPGILPATWTLLEKALRVQVRSDAPAVSEG